ncbi:MAG: hypothetical protein UY35_C0004G0035 [Candidatus Saccharibacteria bacterium GW2011_GWC2_48_9]|nr:MAG: hypothetical protein UY35_C0004G0035 [Candidatus Saccharibacteria bacterium GW2011_GWC2_48_9]HCH34789.1 hypothetical protein [Candidatus Saccharibacteria bacterium]
MGSRFSSGFTIIELMLFLAITGLLISGILVNAAGSLNDQHYRDGVESFRNKISSQYAKVYSLTNSNTVNNETTNVDPCEYIAGNPSATTLRGTSDCLYVGRLVEVIPASNMSKLRITPVVAKQRADLDMGQYYANQQSGANVATDGGISAINARYQIAQYTGSSALVEEDQLDWGLAAVSSGSNAMTRTSLLILRSPIDGTVQTYNLLAQEPDTINYQDLGSRLSAEYAKSVKFCMADLSGSLEPGQRMAVIVQKSATGPGDVETRLNNTEGAPEC